MESTIYHFRAELDFHIRDKVGTVFAVRSGYIRDNPDWISIKRRDVPHPFFDSSKNNNGITFDLRWLSIPL